MYYFHIAMGKRKSLVQTLLFYAVILSLAQSRKYDIENESLKLYGEDLKSVLRRFRRTPEYLKILTDKMEELKTYLGDIALQTHYYYSNKVMEKCKSMFPENKDLTTTTVTVGAVGEPALYYVRESPFQIPVKSFHKNLLLDLRARKFDEERKTPVEVLDSYHMLTSSLTLQERNMFRDLGFEMAGQLIHSMIKSMGSEDFAMKSTKLPFGGGEQQSIIITTSEHGHEVISTNTGQPPGSTAVAEPATDDTFKYKYRAPRVVRQYA